MGQMMMTVMVVMKVMIVTNRLSNTMITSLTNRVHLVLEYSHKKLLLAAKQKEHVHQLGSELEPGNHIQVRTWAILVLLLDFIKLHVDLLRRCLNLGLLD